MRLTCRCKLAEFYRKNAKSLSFTVCNRSVMLSTFVKILQLAPTDWLFKSTKSVMVFENVWAHELKWWKTILNKHCEVEAGCVLGVSVNFISTWQIMPAWSGYISEKNRWFCVFYQNIKSFLKQYRVNTIFYFFENNKRFLKQYCFKRKTLTFQKNCFTTLKSTK